MTNRPVEKQTGRTSRPIDVPQSTGDAAKAPIGSGCFKKRSLPTLDSQEKRC